jgi:hypothetical protein
VQKVETYDGGGDLRNTQQTLKALRDELILDDGGSKELLMMSGTGSHLTLQH